MTSNRNKPDSAVIYRELFSKELSKGEKTQIKIGLKAIRVLGQGGLHQFSLDSVAKELKTTRSHVAYYFTTNEDLLEFVFKMIIQNAQRYTIKELQGKTDPWKLLDGVVLGASNWLQDNPIEVRCWISLFEIASRNERFLELNQQIRNGGLQRIIEILSSIHPDKSLIRIQKQARSIQCHITGELLNFYTTKSTQSFTEIQKQVVEDCRHLASH